MLGGFLGALCGAVVALVVGLGGLREVLQAAEGVGQAAGEAAAGEADVEQAEVERVEHAVDAEQAARQALQGGAGGFAVTGEVGQAQAHAIAQAGGDLVAQVGEGFVDLLGNLRFSEALEAQFDIGSEGVDGLHAQAERGGHAGDAGFEGGKLLVEGAVEGGVEGGGLGFVGPEPAAFVELEVFALEAAGAEGALDAGVFELAAEGAVDEAADSAADGRADGAADGGADGGTGGDSGVAAFADGAVAARDHLADEHADRSPAEVAGGAGNGAAAAVEQAQAGFLHGAGGVGGQPVADRFAGHEGGVAEGALEHLVHAAEGGDGLHAGGAPFAGGGAAGKSRGHGA